MKVILQYKIIKLIWFRYDRTLNWKSLLLQLEMVTTENPQTPLKTGINATCSIFTPKCWNNYEKSMIPEAIDRKPAFQKP